MGDSNYNPKRAERWLWDYWYLVASLFIINNYFSFSGVDTNPSLPSNSSFRISLPNIYMRRYVEAINLPMNDDARSVTCPSHWRHNDHDGASNHQPHCCLLNRLFRRRSKKTTKLRVTGLCAGNSPGPVNSPHKWRVTRKMFPFDDVIML